MALTTVAELRVAPDEQPIASTAIAQILTFRRYVVLPGARQLIRDQHEVEIGGRAFDLLVVLLEARGCIVEKQLIFKRVWPSTIVDESNLRFQMGQLRRTLGCDRDLIKTIPGRGYMLADEQPRSLSSISETALLAAPASLTADEEISALRAQNLQLSQALAKLAAGALALVPNGLSLAGLHDGS